MIEALELANQDKIRHFTEPQKILNYLADHLNVPCSAEDLIRNSLFSLYKDPGVIDTYDFMNLRTQISYCRKNLEGERFSIYSIYGQNKYLLIETKEVGSWIGLPFELGEADASQKQNLEFIYQVEVRSNTSAKPRLSSQEKDIFDRLYQAYSVDYNTYLSFYEIAKYVYAGGHYFAEFDADRRLSVALAGLRKKLTHHPSITLVSKRSFGFKMIDKKVFG